jgi:hypothetical protein
MLDGFAKILQKFVNVYYGLLEEFLGLPVSVEIKRHQAIILQ